MKKNLTNKSNRKRKKTHGFRERMKSEGGRAVLKKRRQKGRAEIVV